MFATRRSRVIQKASSALITTSQSIVIPPGATILHAFLVAGGGSGGAGSGSETGVGGGGAGGSLYVQINLERIVFSLTKNRERLESVSVTVGSGGLAATGYADGNPGGATSLTLGDSGIVVTVNGGSKGAGGNSGSGGNSGTSAVTYNLSHSWPTDPVVARPMLAIPMSGSDAHTGNSTGANGGSCTNSYTTQEAVTQPGVIASTFFFPWWLTAAGLTSLGTAGTSNKVTNGGKGAGGGAGGFNGNGGNSVATMSASGTAGSGTGYGSGGGGIACGTSGTSGAGAPGCAVIMFEVGA